MKVINLTDFQFDDFSKKHVLHTYFQTSNYAKVMSSQGYQIKFLGFLEDNKLIGASLFICDTLFANYKYAYAPRGMLIDYTDNVIVQKITIALKKAFAKEGFVFFKIDPPVVDYKRNDDGKIIAQANILSSRILLASGYKYMGANLFFETLKPRWNAHLNLVNDNTSVLDSFQKQTRNKISKGLKREISVIKLAPNELERFYKFVAKKHYRKINYYAIMQQSFKQDFEAYVACLDTNKYLRTVQSLFEKEQGKNFELGQAMQSASTKGIDMRNLISKKMESDKVLNTYNTELKNATLLLSKYPDSIDIGSLAIIKTNEVVHILIDGFDNKFKNLYPSFVLKWFIIDKYVKQGFNKFDLNAISGDFSEKSKYKGLNEMKLGFGAEVKEYIGEYDLIINGPMYKMYSKLGGQTFIKRRAK